jgi:hypothetical protein
MGGAYLVDIARGELVEHELDILIERRSKQAKLDPEEEHELWRESVRRHNERVQEENRAAWCEYHQGQAERLRANLEALIAEHEAKATLLRGEA